MTEKRKQNYISLFKFLHLTAITVVFFIGWLMFRYGKLTGIYSVGFRYNIFATIGWLVLILFFNNTYNAYLLGYSRIRTLVFSQFLSQFFSTGIIWAGVCIAWRHWVWPWYLLLAVAMMVFIDAAWSYKVNEYYFVMYPPKRTLLIYRNELDKKRFGSIHGKPSERLYRIAEEFQYDGYSFKQIQDRLEGYDAIFVAGVHSRCRNGLAKYCKEKNIVGFFLPHIGDVIMQEAKHIQSFDSPVLFVSRSSLTPEYAFLKRMFDIVVSGLMLIVLSPLMLVTALAIHFYDKGPAIYKQIRLTKDEKEFEIYKFRSMRVDAEKDGVARLSTGDHDDRITPIGRIVRKYRLDELPQLWNIFKGDMSFVGPRPERPSIAESYYEFLPDFRLRLQVRAGLTGYAQVYGKYNTDPYEKLQFDLLYINNMNIMTDIQLLFATFGILFLPESTEGVAVGATTAMDYENPADSTENDAETVTK